LRVVFAGNDVWSVPSLRALASSRHEVVLTCTRSPRPARRGKGTVPTPVAAAATELELPLLEVDTILSGDGRMALERSAPDVLVVVAYGELLPPDILAIPSRGAVNMHFSLLPRYRGAGPVQHALLDGCTETGVTTMLLDEGMDTGPILRSLPVAIDLTEDAGTLGARLALLGAGLLGDTLEDFASGTERLLVQDESLATYGGKLTASDRRIDWGASAASILQRVRAFAPDPGATTTFRGQAVKVLATSLAAAPPEIAPSVTPGSIITAAGEDLVVAAGKGGAVSILALAPAGKAHMNARSFLAGYHPRPQEESFGAADTRAVPGDNPSPSEG